MGYLVTNYGCDKVLKLLDGNIEARKKQLSVYFLTHDNEITPEQASYLADRSMQVLLVGGQMAVHQVAATKFKTERKKNPKKQDSQKKDPKSKKERAEAKDVPSRKKEHAEAKAVPNRKKEHAEAQNVARRGGGSVVGQGKAEGVANAYEIAKAGGRHHGTYDGCVNLPEKSLKKGIRSFQQQIDKHELLIKDPQHYLEVFKKTEGHPPWHQMPSGRRTTLLKKTWPLEIKKFKEQKQILEHILKNRQ